MMIILVIRRRDRRGAERAVRTCRRFSDKSKNSKLSKYCRSSSKVVKLFLFNLSLFNFFNLEIDEGTPDSWLKDKSIISMFSKLPKSSGKCFKQLPDMLISLMYLQRGEGGRGMVVIGVEW